MVQQPFTIQRHAKLATASGGITVTGEVAATSLDISGDVDVDGTLETDALTIGGVTLAETISDTVGAMVSSNTESGITVAYQDADNTLDFTVGTLNQNTTGSAATLTTARTIGGVSFNGSANINLPGVNTTGNQNTSGLAGTATALATARTIGGTSFDGTANIAVGLAATATTLATARTIGGVSFNGSANINLPGVNTAGNQNTSGTAATVTTAAQPNITSLGTLTTLTVDDITINGSTISDAGDLTLDAEGDIILDANGGDWRLKDAGTTIVTMSNVSGDFYLKNNTSNKDIKFYGNDNGTEVLALTLDMSDAGTAIFNHDAVFGDNDRILLGNSSDLQILHDGSNSYIASNTGDFLIDSAGDIVLDAAGDDIRFKDNGTQSFVFTQGTGSTMSAPRGNLTLDVAGDILLDSGNGYVKLQDAGTEYGRLYESSNRLVIQAMVNNSALLFSGIDGGSGFTAMSMDMSDQGVATFNRGIKFNNDTAAANELDDYEEGTFTPSNEGGTTGGFGSPSGTYIKIGKQITCDFRFETTGGVDGGLNYRVLRSFPYAMYQNDYIGLLGAVSAYNLDQYMGGYIIQASTSEAIDFFVGWHQNSSGGTRIRCSVTYRTV